MSSNRTMHVVPRATSHGEVCSILRNIDDHICVNVAPFAGIPSMSLSCEVTIINATAEVKPELTGPLTKSMRNPSKRKTNKKKP